MANMTKNNVKLDNILLALKEHDPDNVSTIQTIYNERYSYRKSIRGPRTEMQQLMLMLESHKYVHFHRKDVSDNIVQDIFWAHEVSVKLFHTFPIVVILESYNTNRYNLPLLEMVGVTSTDITYSIAFAYMEFERSDNYVWALSCLKHLIVSENGQPKVFLVIEILHL